MLKLAKLSLLAATMAVAATGASGAQSVEKRAFDPTQAVKGMDQAQIERSWQIQADIARLEQDKEAFVDGMLGSWAPYVDSSMYKLSEIKGAAMAAKSWQLYGASLVGDFQTMLRVLNGEVSAGQYIQAYSTPQPRNPATTKNLGATLDSLVLYPIPPCRIIDTVARAGGLVR
jgi:hypothetical protein